MESLFEGDGLTPIYHLQKALFDEYGSPDKRVKKFEKVTHFRVDVCQSGWESPVKRLRHLG